MSTARKDKLTQPIKYFGGKHYLAPKFIAMFPEHVHYVEPFAGGLAVLLEKDEPDIEGHSEVVNDLNYELINFWCALRDESAFAKFHRIMEATPFAEWVWDGTAPPDEFVKNLLALCDVPESEQQITRAACFFIRCRQSRAGQFKDFATLSRSRTRRGMNEQASAWLTAVEGLPAVHARLKRVVVLNRPAADVIRQQDGPATFFYIDAPYVHSTRSSNNDYSHEMTDDQHRELIQLLIGIKGKAMVSMYHHPIYDALALEHGWRVVEFEIDNKASGSKTKRRMTECVWMNYQK